MACGKAVPLDGHSMTSYEGGFFFFGGYDMQSEISDRLHFLDMRTLTFECIMTTGENPGPRQKHQCLIIKERLFVFGGHNHVISPGQRGETFLAVFCLDLGTRIWSNITRHMHGDIPRALRGHSCCYDDFSGKVYLFGGFDSGTFERTNKFFSFDTSCQEWKLLKSLNNVCPTPRALHCAFVLAGSLYIFGGNDGFGKQAKIADNWKYYLRVQPPSLKELAGMQHLKLQPSVFF